MINEVVIHRKKATNMSKFQRNSEIYRNKRSMGRHLGVSYKTSAQKVTKRKTNAYLISS